MKEFDQLSNSQLPQFPEPYWRASVDLESFPPLTEDITVDVAIVGAGITGITAAYLLSKEGLKVTVVEAGKILNGTTGHTTAKITAQHDIIYDEMINHFGLEKTQLYYNAATDAANFIKGKISEYQIQCDLQQEDAIIYTNDQNNLSKLEKESRAYEKLGIDFKMLDSIPLPIPMKSALVMPNQAQFHPLQYLQVLVNEAIKNGVDFYEHTAAKNIYEGEDVLQLHTRNEQKITCKQVISASHFPFDDGSGFYFSRMYQDRSYVIAVKPEIEYPGGMYLSADNPKRSLRYTTIDGEKLILVGGENHKTGQGVSTIEHYEALEKFANETLGTKAIPYRWSAQDLTTLDKVPYIGPISENHSNIYVATGYRKWGMTNGTAAALLLKDLIMEKKNPYTELYHPSRFVADPSIKTFVSQNVDVAKHLIEGKIEMILKVPEELENDEGAVVTVHGKRAGAYRDDEGKLHIVDTTCTHMGCEVEWNSGDRTWDCPCHGSRFSVSGEVVEGPAKEPLKKLP